PEASSAPSAVRPEPEPPASSASATPPPSGSASAPPLSAPPPSEPTVPTLAPPPVAPAPSPATTVQPKPSEWQWASPSPPGDRVKEDPNRHPARVPWKGTSFVSSHALTTSLVGVGGDYQSSAYRVYTQGYSLLL